MRCDLSLLVTSGVLVVGVTSLVPARAEAWCQMVSGNIRPSPGEPCVLASNHEGIFPLAWRRRCTSMSISSALPPNHLTNDEVLGVLDTAFATWTNVDCGGALTGLDVEVMRETNACTEAVHHTDGHNVNSILFVTEGWSLDRMHAPNAYAVTFVWHDPTSGEIYDADIEVNETRGRYTICPEAGCTDSRIDLPNVLTHEIGHYFGIAHSPDDVFATMHASAPPGETIKRSLTDDDMGALCTIYTPGSLPEACDHTPRGGLDLSCSPGCGCEVPGDDRHAGSASLALGLVALALATRRRAK